METKNSLNNIYQFFFHNCPSPAVITNKQDIIIQYNTAAEIFFKIYGIDLLEQKNINFSVFFKSDLLKISDNYYKFKKIDSIETSYNIILIEKDNNIIEKNYQTMIENVDDAISIHDLNFKRLFFNSALSKLYGYEKDIYAKLPAFFNIHNDDYENIKSQAVIEELLKSRKKTFHFRAQHKNGKWLYINSKAIIIDDDYFHKKFILLITQDYTEKILAKQKLKESEEKYRFLVENSSDATLRISWEKQKYEYISPIIEQVTSFSAEYFYNDINFIFSILTKESLENTLAMQEQIAKNGDIPSVYEFEIIDKFGKKRWLEQKSLVLKNSQNQPIGLHARLSNITEKKRIQTSMKESEERFRQLGTLLPQIIFECSSEAIFTFMNDEGLKQFQISKEEFLKGIETFSLIDEEYVEEAKKIFQERLAGNYGGMELKFKRKDGSSFYGLSYSNAAFFNGKTIIRGIIVDITKNKMIEAEKASLLQKLNNLNSTKDKFFSIISHDLRDPFNSLLGLSELLLEEFDDLDEEERKEYIFHLYSTSKATYNLLQNLLDWSKTQRGEIPYNPQNINLLKRIEEIIENLRVPLTKKAIEINLDIGKNIYVFADSNMLNSILSNLISNGIKFSNEKSKINISAIRIDKMIEIEVVDFGIGIKKDSLEKIFNSNHIFSSRGTKNEKGSGLGLLLCKEFTEKHGGKINISSEVNKGTQITISLPDFNENIIEEAYFT